MTRIHQPIFPYLNPELILDTIESGVAIHQKDITMGDRLREGAPEWPSLARAAKGPVETVIFRDLTSLMVSKITYSRSNLTAKVAINLVLKLN